MSDLDFIDLQIAIADKAPEKPGFGVGLIADYHTAWPDLVREYSAADDLLSDGFTSSSSVYQKAVDLKSQIPSPSTFKVGRLTTPYVQTVRLLPRVTTEGFVYNGMIGSTAITYTVPVSATLASIATAIELLVEAVTNVASSVVSTTIIEAVVTGPALAFTFDRGMDVIDVTAAPGTLADELSAIANEDDDWYGLLLVPQSKPVILAAAAWVEAQRKMYVPQSADWDVVDAGQTSDIATALVALAYTRTAGIWHRPILGAENADAAWLGLQLALDPGSYTAAFKTLAGVSVDDLRTGEMTALKNKKWTRYKRQRGANITFEGRTPSGRFIDVVRFVDWLTVEIETDLFFLLINNPKVPFTAAGISQAKGCVLGTLQRGKKRPNDGLDPDFTSIVTAPTVAETNATDRANRLLKTIQFTDRLSGALHGITIRGTISV